MVRVHHQNEVGLVNENKVAIRTRQNQQQHYNGNLGLVGAGLVEAGIRSYKRLLGLQITRTPLLDRSLQNEIRASKEKRIGSSMPLNSSPPLPCLSDMFSPLLWLLGYPRQVSLHVGRNSSCFFVTFKGIVCIFYRYDTKGLFQTPT